MANAEKTTGASARVVIEAENIVKNYGHSQALKGASLKVYAGEVTALLGDNGAGKSTLANIISGAIPRTSGRLLCNGKEIDAQSIQQAQDMELDFLKGVMERAEKMLEDVNNIIEGCTESQTAILTNVAPTMA